MARILTFSPEQAQGPLREILSGLEKQYGYLPGIYRTLLVDPEIGSHLGAVYAHLNMRPNSTCPSCSARCWRRW